MAQKSTNDAGAVPTQKQRFSVYTMMLILSFIAICTACTLLYMELDSYGKFPYWDANEARFTPPAN